MTKILDSIMNIIMVPLDWVLAKFFYWLLILWPLKILNALDNAINFITGAGVERILFGVNNVDGKIDIDFFASDSPLKTFYLISIGIGSTLLILFFGFKIAHNLFSAKYKNIIKQSSKTLAVGSIVFIIPAIFITLLSLVSSLISLISGGSPAVGTQDINQFRASNKTNINNIQTFNDSSNIFDQNITNLYNLKTGKRDANKNIEEIYQDFESLSQNDSLKILAKKNFQEYEEIKKEIKGVILKSHLSKMKTIINNLKIKEKDENKAQQIKDANNYFASINYRISLFVKTANQIIDQAQLDPQGKQQQMVANYQNFFVNHFYGKKDDIKNQANTNIKDIYVTNVKSFTIALGILKDNPHGTLVLSNVLSDYPDSSLAVTFYQLATGSKNSDWENDFNINTKDLANGQLFFGSVLIIAACGFLVTICFMALVRLIDLALLITISPIPVFIAPIDGGERVSLWIKAFSEELLSILGAIIVLRLLGPLGTSYRNFLNTNQGFLGDRKLFLLAFFYIASLIAAQKAILTIASIFGIGEGIFASMNLDRSLGFMASLKGYGRRAGSYYYQGAKWTVSKVKPGYKIFKKGIKGTYNLIRKNHKKIPKNISKEKSFYSQKHLNEMRLELKNYYKANKHRNTDYLSIKLLTDSIIKYNILKHQNIDLKAKVLEKLLITKNSYLAKTFKQKWLLESLDLSAQEKKVFQKMFSKPKQIINDSESETIKKFLMSYATHVYPKNVNEMIASNILLHLLYRKINISQTIISQKKDQLYLKFMKSIIPSSKNKFLKMDNLENNDWINNQKLSQKINNYILKNKELQKQDRSSLYDFLQMNVEKNLHDKISSIKNESIAKNIYRNSSKLLEPIFWEALIGGFNKKISIMNQKRTIVDQILLNKAFEKQFNINNFNKIKQWGNVYKSKKLINVTDEKAIILDNILGKIQFNNKSNIFKSNLLVTKNGFWKETEIEYYNKNKTKANFNKLIANSEVSNKLTKEYEANILTFINNLKNLKKPKNLSDKFYNENLKANVQTKTKSNIPYVNNLLQKRKFFPLEKARIEFQLKDLIQTKPSDISFKNKDTNQIKSIKQYQNQQISTLKTGLRKTMVMKKDSIKEKSQELSKINKTILNTKDSKEIIVKAEVVKETLSFKSNFQKFILESKHFALKRKLNKSFAIKNVNNPNLQKKREILIQKATNLESQINQIKSIKQYQNQQISTLKTDLRKAMVIKKDSIKEKSQELSKISKTIPNSRDSSTNETLKKDFMALQNINKNILNINQREILDRSNNVKSITQEIFNVQTSKIIPKAAKELKLKNLKLALKEEKTERKNLKTIKVLDLRQEISKNIRLITQEIFNVQTSKIISKDLKESKLRDLKITLKEKKTERENITKINRTLDLRQNISNNIKSINQEVDGIPIPKKIPEKGDNSPVINTSFMTRTMLEHNIRGNVSFSSIASELKAQNSSTKIVGFNASERTSLASSSKHLHEIPVFISNEDKFKNKQLNKVLSLNKKLDEINKTSSKGKKQQIKEIKKDLEDTKASLEILKLKNETIATTDARYNPIKVSNPKDNFSDIKPKKLDSVLREAPTIKMEIKILKSEQSWKDKILRKEKQAKINELQKELKKINKVQDEFLKNPFSKKITQKNDNDQKETISLSDDSKIKIQGTIKKLEKDDKKDNLLNYKYNRSQNSQSVEDLTNIHLLDSQTIKKRATTFSTPTVKKDSTYLSKNENSFLDIKANEILSKNNNKEQKGIATKPRSKTFNEPIFLNEKIIETSVSSIARPRANTNISKLPTFLDINDHRKQQKLKNRAKPRSKTFNEPIFLNEKIIETSVSSIARPRANTDVSKLPLSLDVNHFKNLKSSTLKDDKKIKILSIDTSLDGLMMSQKDSTSSLQSSHSFLSTSSDYQTKNDFNNSNKLLGETSIRQPEEISKRSIGYLKIKGINVESDYSSDSSSDSDN